MTKILDGCFNSVHVVAWWHTFPLFRAFSFADVDTYGIRVQCNKSAIQTNPRMKFDKLNPRIASCRDPSNRHMDGWIVLDG